MDHTNLILIISIISVASTAGIYVVVRKIIQSTPTPQNILTRRGDIELGNLTEPTQPLQTYYPSEWLREVSSCPPSYNMESVNENMVIGYIPSHQAEIIYINCCLENENNFIIILIILIIIISLFIMLKKYTEKF